MVRIFSVLFGLALVASFSACETEYPIQPNAVILGEGIDCGWLVKFNETPTSLPTSEDNTYVVVNLAEKYQIEDLDVMITAREAAMDELLTCTALGPGYVQVFIEDIF